MDREEALLNTLAERPFDRALRLVFADWLLERGDPRGEVIALCARGGLSLTERRRVADLTSRGASAWLGPLKAVADLRRTRFRDGFLDELVGLTPRLPALYHRLAGEPRLATVRALTIEHCNRVVPLEGFLAHPVLGALERLELSASDWQGLARLQAPHLTPRTVGVSLVGGFEGALLPLEAVPLFMQGRHLDLVTTEFANPPTVSALVAALEGQHGALERFLEVRLLARYGVLEGTVAWLLSLVDGRRLPQRCPTLTRWVAEFSEVRFSLERDARGAFSLLTIDAAPHEDLVGLDKRLAVAAAVLVQLGPARLASVEVRVPSGARLRRDEQDALRAAARRLRSVDRLVLGGERLA